jgi:hypothetical protein
MARGKKKMSKTVRAPSCATGRAYAKGKSKGKCVPPKPHKGCWAKTKRAAAEQLQIYDRRVASALHMQAKVKERKAAHDAPLKNPRQFFGLGGHSRRRRRHHR